MIDLKTTYMGLELAHPFIPGAGPLAKDLDHVKKLQDNGANVVVLNSLFEEQILAEQSAALTHVDAHQDSFGEALSFLPNSDLFTLGPDAYLEHIQKLKQLKPLKVIASINGCTKGGWIRYAKLMEQAGADALELNTYMIATQFEQSAKDIENALLELVQSVKSSIQIPLAVKLSPYYTSLPNLAKRLESVGVNGLVLFNRFYQPDIDVNELNYKRTIELSKPSELLPRLHALAILSKRIKPSLAISGGVHSHLDAVKALMSGAHCVQMVSALLIHGPSHLQAITKDLYKWLDENEYESVTQMIGSMDFTSCPNPKLLERLNYLEVLQSWNAI